MPITVDILENKVFARAYRRGELSLLRLQIDKRFGPIPPWAEERLTNYSSGTLEELGERLFDAASLEDLLASSLSESP